MRTRKTFQEHCEFVEELSRLSFFFAFRLQVRLPELSLEEIIRRHTPFFHHELDLESRAQIPQFQVLNASCAEEFEEKMWNQIRPLALDRAARFYRSSIGMAVPETYNAGSLKYDPPREGLPANYCNFHIANAVAPKSIFDDPDYLAECLLELIRKSSAEYGFDTLRTSTWLNDRDRFLAYFPQEWSDNRVLQPYYEDQPDIPGWTLGNWGQLITARGTFNKKMGEYVREHLAMRYKTYISSCPFAKIKKHLEEKRYVKESS